ncbi:MAG: hypothetical protein FWH18_03480 [Marinilabiliaceae bacterium]|nr:hypothetical protein [Marinilabiliaceae bacterium]
MKFFLKPFLIFFFICFLIVELFPQTTENEICIVKNITINGNHRTKDAVILSELPFSIDSEIIFDQLIFQSERAKQNILNTSLFNKVEIQVQHIDNNEITINIDVDERWYLWVLPIFENAGRNFSDFLYRNDGSWFIYGIYIKHYNFRGRNEKISLRAVTGYKDQFEFAYENPGRSNGSGWKFFCRSQRDNQTAFNTFGDEQIYLKLTKSWTVRQNMIEMNYYLRDGIYKNHRFLAAYEDVKISDNLFALNPNFLPLSAQKSRQLIAGYEFKFDTRNLKIYATDGNYFEGSVIRTGMGMVSDYNGFFDAKIVTGLFRPLSKRFFANSLLTLQAYSKKEIPYFFKAGMGYDDYMNGFEYKVVDGSFYSTLKNQLLFELVPRRDKTLNFIPVKQFSKFHYAFYLRLHLDAGYVYNGMPVSENKLPNSFLLGYGIGFDLVTIYDKVLSVNYSRTNFGDYGFFVHFNLGL